MKTFLALALFAFNAAAADVKLAWDAPTEPVINYEVMWRTNTAYTNVSLSTLRTNTLTGLKVGTQYFLSVRGVQAFGLRGKVSSEFAYTVPAAATYRDVVALEGQGYNGQPWLKLATNTFTTPTNKNYRLTIQRIKQ